METPETQPDVNWIPLPGNWTLADAAVAKSVLEAAEIPCFEKNAVCTNLFPGVSILDSGIRLEVPRNLRLDALEALSTMRDFEDSEWEEAPEQCDQCGSTEVALGQPRGILAKLATLLMPVDLEKEGWHCQRCGAALKTVNRRPDYLKKEASRGES